MFWHSLPHWYERDFLEESEKTCLFNTRSIHRAWGKKMNAWVSLLRRKLVDLKSCLASPGVRSWDVVSLQPPHQATVWGSWQCSSVWTRAKLNSSRRSHRNYWRNAVTVLGKLVASASKKKLAESKKCNSLLMPCIGWPRTEARRS